MRGESRHEHCHRDRRWEPTRRSESSARSWCTDPTSPTSGCRRRNCHELLFDDVIWVRRARQEFDAFVDLMRERGVEVLLLHELLAETLEDAEAREWLLSRRVRPEEVTVMFAEPLCATGSREMPAEELATRLTGGVTVLELPDEIRSAIGRGAPSDRLRAAAASQPALHARHERLALRRRHAQPDVLAGAAARDPERRGDLPLPSALQRRGLRDLVRRRRPRLGLGAASRAAT